MVVIPKAGADVTISSWVTEGGVLSVRPFWCGLRSLVVLSMSAAGACHDAAIFGIVFLGSMESLHDKEPLYRSCCAWHGRSRRLGGRDVVDCAIV